MTPALYINSAGMVEAVDPGRAREVEGLGWVPASAEQARDYFLREKYGSAGQAAIAGVEAAGSMATLGLSTHLETALGVDPEGIAAREKFNPMAKNVGAGVGILAPLLLSGGASAAVEGAEMTGAAARAARMAGPSLLAQAGKATARAALRELPEGASLAQRLAAKGMAAAAGGAVEGAGYEAGQLVHESALGDPNLTAEAALARIGMSAATFGALSGGGSILGVLAGEVGGAAGKGDLGKKLAGWLGEFEGERNIKAAGGIQSDLTRARKQIGREGLTAIGREMGELGLVSPLSTPAQTLERADALMGRAGATMGDVLSSADEIGRAEGATLGDLRGALRRARSEVLAPLAKDPFQQEAAGKLESLLTGLEAKGPGVTLEDLHQLRRQGDAALYGMRGTMDPYATAYRQGLHDLRGILSETIEAGVEKSGVPLDIWKTANREYQVAARAAEFAEKGLDRAHGNNLVSPTEFLSTLAGGLGGGPAGGLAGGLATAAARRFGSGTLGRMARGLRGLLEGEEGALVANGTAAGIAAERAASVGGVPGAAVAAGMPPRGVVAGAAIAARASASAETAAALAVLARAKVEVTREVDSAIGSLLRAAPAAAGRTAAALASRSAVDAVNVRRLANSPELLLETLARQTDELHGHAPGIAQAAQLGAARRVAFLASKAPAASLPGLHAKATRPNAHELAKFGRYADVIRNPLRALEHARRGTLTPQHVGALRLGWPATYQHVQERTLWALMGHGGKTVPPASRLMLSMLTGFQLDASLAPNAIAANHAVYARQANRSIIDQSGPVPNPNAGKLNQANRVRTPTQGLSERLNGGK